MKQFLPTVLALVCVVLVIALIVIKNSDNTQHENDAASITDFSNQVISAQSQITTRDATILTFSNSLDECRSASFTFSNHLTEAESTIARYSEQITNLSRQLAETESENQTLGAHVMDLTNQMAGLTKRITLAEASLNKTNKDLVQAYKDYALLENRFRIDVAERVVVERKFNNISEVKFQLQQLRENPPKEISAESIYAGLDVEVKSNGACHVIAPH